MRMYSVSNFENELLCTEKCNLPGEYADGSNIRPLNIKKNPNNLTLGTRTSTFTPAHKLSVLLDCNL